MLDNAISPEALPHAPLANPALTWQCGRYSLVLNRPYVMGILNVTPDSFSDGGQHAAVDAAIAHAHQMIADGVDIIDIGGESTRPNAPVVSCCEELGRIMPVIEALRDCGVPLSIDTQKPYVMRQVLDYGVDIINDVQGFRSCVAIDAVADSDCGLCMMHMQGTPQTMQNQPTYTDVVDEVHYFFTQQIHRLQRAGIHPQRMCIDPGIGFGKTLEHNLALLRASQTLRQHEHAHYPVLIGVSRKRMIGDLTGRSQPAERVSGSVAAALWAVHNGANIVRVHDVAATVDALKVWGALDAYSPAAVPIG